MPAKVRRIKGSQVVEGETFDFNRSIVPNGGTLGRLNIIERNDGSAKIKVFQDINNDGKLSNNEVIYKGMIAGQGSYDELTTFSGKVKLTKEMHACIWATAKDPDKLIPCTMDYVPTVHELTLLGENGGEWTAEGLGKFGLTDLMW